MTGPSVSLAFVLAAIACALAARWGWAPAGGRYVTVFFAFIGFDVVATTAEEARDPQRTVPRGILGSLAIVTVLYVATALVATGMVTYQTLATTTSPSGAPERKTLATAFAANNVDWAANIISVGALAANNVDWAANIISVGALAGLTTAVMVLLLGQIRVLFAMSRDGLLPRGQARGDGQRRHPVRVHPGVSRGGRAPPHPPGPPARLPRPLGAPGADPLHPCLPVADAEPHRAHLAPLPRLDGDRHRRLLRLQPPPLPPRPPNGGTTR